MPTLADIATLLNRPPIVLAGLQKRFELPTPPDGIYADAYLEFLRTIVYLRSFGISEETLRDLWSLEKKLLLLLHVEASGSPTWFLDACGRPGHRERRLLLSHFDLGIPLNGRELQPGLDFSDQLPELFSGREMGEDAWRVLHQCIELRETILRDVRTELPVLRTAAKWAIHLPAPPNH